MAARILRLLLALLLLASADSVRIAASDLKTLLLLKAAWTGIDLSSWNSTTNCNLATGLSCNSGGFVTDIYLGFDDATGNFNGYLPDSIGDLHALQTLYLGSYYLGGAIPESIGNLAHLRILNLRSQLTGPIPSSIGKLTALSELYLGGNRLTGSIPASIGNLTHLDKLYLGLNQLTGPLPATVGKLHIGVMWMSNNQLTGPMPEGISDAAYDLGFLDSNQFVGVAPPTMAGLNVSTNFLTGFMKSVESILYSPFDFSENCITNFTNTTDDLGGYRTSAQRPPAECTRFCNVSPRSPQPCSGHGYCYLGLSGSRASCICDPNFQPGAAPYTCVPAKGFLTYVRAFDVPNAYAMYGSSYNNNFRYSSSGFLPAKSDRVIPTTIGWTNLVLSVRTQGLCGAGWAFSGVGAIEYAVAIAYNLTEAPALSEQQALSCIPRTSGCRGGWPSSVFQYAAAKAGLTSNQNYPYDPNSARTPACAPQKIVAAKYPVKMWEQVGVYGRLGLLLALQHQPVVVSIAADDLSFLTYTGGVYSNPRCFSGRIVSHNVLVVGYVLSKVPYWLIKNSWGPGWGEGGYMRLLMDESRGGICGIYTRPGIYPVVAGPRPCAAANNPCGGGKCVAGAGGAYSCICQAPAFVQFKNVDGTRSCAPVQQCQLGLTSPCGAGACLNDGKGSYVCICPPGFTLTKRATGDPTCQKRTLNQLWDIQGMECMCHDKGIKQAPGQKAYTTRGQETCENVMITFNLTASQFRKLNPKVSCGKQLAAATILFVGRATDGCSTFYTPSPGQSCAAVASYFSIPASTFQALNQGLNCSQPLTGQQVCTRRGSFSDSLCIRPYYISKGDNSCSSVMKSQNMTVVDFFALNPGVNCNYLTKNYAGGELCLGRAPAGVPNCKLGRPYKTVGGESCASIVKSNFNRNATNFQKYNNAYVTACSAQYFHPGVYFCVP